MKRAYYRNIPCHFNPNTNEIEGRNRFYDFLIDIMLRIDIVILNNEAPIWVEENEENDEKGMD